MTAIILVEKINGCGFSSNNHNLTSSQLGFQYQVEFASFDQFVSPIWELLIMTKVCMLFLLP